MRQLRQTHCVSNIAFSLDSEKQFQIADTLYVDKPEEPNYSKRLWANSTDHAQIQFWNEAIIQIYSANKTAFSLGSDEQYWIAEKLERMAEGAKKICKRLNLWD